MTKKVYHYNTETFEYIGETDALQSPLDAEEGNDVYLVPAYATFTAPPKPEKDKKAVFNEISGKWVNVYDFRGKTYYDTARNPVVITEFGQVPEGLTEQPRPFTQEELAIQKENALRGRFSATADPLFMSWQAALAAGDINAETKRQLWISERQKIIEEVNLEFAPKE